MNCLSSELLAAVLEEENKKLVAQIAEKEKENTDLARKVAAVPIATIENILALQSDLAKAREALEKISKFRAMPNPEDIEPYEQIARFSKELARSTLATLSPQTLIEPKEGE